MIFVNIAGSLCLRVVLHTNPMPGRETNLGLLVVMGGVPKTTIKRIPYDYLKILLEILGDHQTLFISRQVGCHVTFLFICSHAHP